MEEPDGDGASALAAECRRHLAAVEADIGDARRTQEAVRWGMRMLLALECSQSELEPDAVGRVSMDVSSAATGRKRRALEALENPKSKMTRIAHEFGTTGDDAVGFQGTLSLDKVLEKVEKGELAEWMDKRLASKMSSPDCASVVNLIDHCLLVSLDQNIPELDNDERQGSSTLMDADKFSSLPVGNSTEPNMQQLAVECPINGADEQNDQDWLHKWVVTEVLYNKLEKDDQNLIRFPYLDWVLAYLTATRTDLLLRVLFDELVTYVLKNNFQGSSLVPYLRQASILELAALRVPEHVSAVSLSLVPPERFSSLLMEWSRNHESTRDGHRLEGYAYAWMVQSALCPKFLACLARAWAPSFKVETVEIVWELLQSEKSRQVPLPLSWTTGVGCNLDGMSDARAWLSMILIKHFGSLSSVGAHIAVLLNKAGPFLLEWLNKEISRSIILQITGNRIDNQGSLFCQNLKHNMYSLWDALLCRLPSLVCRCTSSSEGPVSQGRELRGCRKCTLQDSFLQTCQITLLGCEDDVVAELLAQATVLDISRGNGFDMSSMKKLQIVVMFMRIFGVMDRDQLILKLWAQSIVNRLQISDCDQALMRILAVRQLVDPLFWDKYAGGGWKCTWKNLCMALNSQWLQLLVLLHREGNDELSMNTLGLLHFLSLEGELSSQAVALHLKAAVGVFLFWVKDSVNLDDSVDEAAARKWHHFSAIALLKKIIVYLASSCTLSFTLLVTILLDSSLQAGQSRQLMKSSSTPNNTELKSEVGSHSASKFPTRTTILHKVDRHDKVAFPFVRSSDAYTNRQQCLLDENCSPGPLNRNGLRTMGIVANKLQTSLTSATYAEIGNLMMLSFKKALKQHQAKSESWTSHPVEVLGKLLVDRLETPHEMSMTMEQYEEVLPKHVSSFRHAFLIDCFGRNPFLFKVLQIVMEYGEPRELQACAEFVHALLAESISQWHDAFRSQHAGNSADKGGAGAALDRMQLFHVIQLITSAGWLPQPLASCGEIISLINGEDIASLLCIIWRCMHDAVASLYVSPTDADNQASEANKGEGYKDWEGQFLCILRRNVSRVGAHFARVYPNKQA